MAVQKCYKLDFGGTLRVEVGYASCREDVRHGTAQEQTWPKRYRFGTTFTPPERLKIDAPRVCFDCLVKANVTGIGYDYEAGILQSIFHASWLARYSNGEKLKYRVNTDRGLVRDGRTDNPIFIQNGHPFKMTSVVEVSFIEQDQPGVTFLTELPEDLLHPCLPPAKPLPQLSRTEGKVKFHTFLAVLNRKTQAITT